MTEQAMSFSDRDLTFLVPLALSMLAMALGFAGGYGVGSLLGDSSSAREVTTTSVVPAAGAFADPIEAGRTVYAQFGCANCHGSDGVGGVANANAATGELVPSLIYVREAYTEDELKALIRKGVPVIGKLNPDGPKPPLFMPPWEGVITERQLGVLAQYLFHLYPEEEALDW